MLSYNKALQTITEHLSVIPLKTEKVSLEESTGRILAEDVISDINLPPFNNSAMDGYAIKYHPEIRKWDIIGELSAGKYTEIKLDNNTAVSIMTGAKLPDGADTVIPIENCILTDSSFSVLDNYNLKQNSDVRKMGEDLKKGELAISSGRQIQTKNISIAAACGKAIFWYTLN